ncbi:hypothetical protein WP12_03320 [Sphingomonas sp. SRS2]|nr:hypothetical protein WP12_03320 [Sphingomonas sp. SRS2]
MIDEMPAVGPRQCETPEMLSRPIVGQDTRGCGGVFLGMVIGVVLFWAVFGVGVVTIVDWIRA